MSEGKIQVVVRSRRVPANVVEVTTPRMSYSGLWIGSDSRRSVIYRSEFDGEHQKVVEEGQRLADQMGLSLEIVDESRSNFMKRAVAALRGSPSSPKLVITPSYPSAYAGACADGLTTAC